MWWCASGYVVVAHEILVSAQGPFLGFWVWGLGVWGLGLTIISFWIIPSLSLLSLDITQIFR